MKQSLQPLTNSDNIKSVVYMKKVDRHSNKNQNPKTKSCSHEKNIQLNSCSITTLLLKCLYLKMNKICTSAFDQLILSFYRFNIKIQRSITTILPTSYIKTHQKLHTSHNLCLLCVKQDGHHQRGSPKTQMLILLITSF